MNWDWNRAAKGAMIGNFAGGPIGMGAGALIAGMSGGSERTHLYGGGPQKMGTSFGQAPSRGAGSQSAYNAPDQMPGAPSLRPMGMPRASAPQLITDGNPMPARSAQPMSARQPMMPGGMPMQPKSFQNGSATLGLANPTYYKPAPATMPMAPRGYGAASNGMQTNGFVQDAKDAWRGIGGGGYGPADPNGTGHTDLGRGNVSDQIRRIRNSGAGGNAGR